ncbi:hypothetical protein ABH933_001213 [Nocardia sp. GP40]|uniref:hypothetical protein n=1 Tax=Nocardia sp. GP40 TaxID=3156268 RepID=UPI003D238AC3
MATQVRYSEIPAGTFVVVHPIGHRDCWTARVIEHRRWPDSHKFTGITNVEVIDPCGFANIRQGMGVDVETKTLTVGATALAASATALVHKQIETDTDTDTAARIMTAIAHPLADLIGSVARNAAETARTDALEYAAWQLQNHRHHAEAPELATAWWATWNAIARHIDIGRCADCNDHGTYQSIETGRHLPCAHPHIYRWAGPNATLTDYTDYATNESRLGYIPSRWTR